jgi:hypothetical protein
MPNGPDSNRLASTPVRDVLSRMPEWVRQDLANKDPTARARAEETLAAMIGAAMDAATSKVD